MCGVFGILDSSMGLDLKRKLTLGAVAELNHRGPDGWGVYFAPGIALGHVRLSIVDVELGHQPMINDFAVVSFNGEIYNHVELRAEMESQGVVFTTKSDTEVILKLYQKEGASCFSRFNGQFSILIWDKSKQALIVARDRYGIRPLYVLEHNGNRYFSSELKAFDCIPDFKREFDLYNLYEHALLWNTLGDATIYKKIRSIESGTYEVYEAGNKPVVSRYYQVGEGCENQPLVTSFDEAVNEFRSLMADSVALRLRSDVPVGAYLSGGIDSTVISHIIHDQTEHTFSTFSVAFDDDKYDESVYQVMASEDIGSTHHSISVSREDVDSYISTTVCHTERPVFRTAPVPLHLLSKKVRENNIKVVLTGEGADEILFGYDTFKELKILESWKADGEEARVVEYIRELYPHLSHYADSKRFGLMKMYYEGFLPDFDNNLAGLNIRINNNKIIGNFFSKELGLVFDKGQLLEKLNSSLPEAFESWSLLQKNSYLELKTLLPGYLLSSQGDRMAMSNGVEGRFPFLDHRVVEMAFAMPDEFKLKGFDQKHILKKAYEGSIPSEIVNRPKRPYVAPDLVSFVRDDGTLTDVAQELLSEEKIIAYKIFDPKTVARFLKKFRKGVPPNTGYRDNMIFIFLLTTQSCQYWIENWVSKTPDHSKCTVDVSDY